MAVLGRVLFSSSERVDLPDLLSIDSYAAGDWKYFLQGIVGNTKPYILSGFDVISPETAIGSTACSVRVADSIVYYPGSSAGPFFHGLPEGNEASEPLTPQLRVNATNYIYLTLTTFNTAADTRALWDPDKNGGEGAEFTQDINTESVIKAQINVSTNSFPTNTVPIAVVTMGPTTILSIQDARDLLFRLGSGGLNPSPLNTYAFRNLPSAQYARAEPDSTITSGSGANPFQGGDKNIRTLKEWMDVVMTKLRELGGTTYWYEATDTLNIIDLFNDALGISWKSKGSYTHDSSEPGRLSWSEDIYIKSTTSPKDVVIRASASTPLDIGNEQVAFLPMTRNAVINPVDAAVAFTNGQSYINTVGGSVGLFQNLKKGDWIKKTSDDDVLFLQVREFYNTAQSPGPVAGSPTTPANARSITLSGPYQGTTSPPSGDNAVFDRGEYLATDIQVVDRNDPILTSTGGNNLWFALRSDTILPIATIVGVELNGTVTQADGNSATITCVDHGLIDGDRITVSAPAEHAGTFSVDVIDDDVFVIKSTDTALGGFTAGYGLATTTSRSIDGFQMESANHGFDSGETVFIEDTDGYNGMYVVNVRTATQFQFALDPDVDSFPVEENNGTVTLARIDVRSEEGINKLIQGETIDIGSNTTDNIRAFVGMTSQDQTAPVYSLPPDYNTLIGGANYNTSLNDNLTARVSKLNGMLMNKAQDKAVLPVTDALAAINVDGGSGVREVSFAPTGSVLTLSQPGSPGNAVVALPDSSAPLELAANQVAYVVIDRNKATTPGIVVVPASEMPVGENVFVIARRLNSSSVYLWNGHTVKTSAPLSPADPAFVVVDLYDPVSASTTVGSVVVDGVTVTAGDKVLFSGLTGADSIIYEAVGVSNSISHWEPVFAFHGLTSPVNGDAAVVKSGASFGLQVGKFDGTDWLFNDKVRQFNGVDYVEQSAPLSGTINDGVTEELFSVEWLNNEHMLIDYSVVRGTARETGTMRVVTDGADATVAADSSYVNGNTGVNFDAAIVGNNLVISYTSDAAGQTGTIKYMVKRWASGTGGAAGIPVYSGAAPTPTNAGGPINSIQFNSGGAVTGNVNFGIDVADLSMNLNGLRQGVLSSALTLVNDSSSWTNLFTMSDENPFVVVEYSVAKDGQARVGSILVACNGPDVSFTESHTETSTVGFEIQVIKSGNDLQFQYKTAAGTGDGTFKYSWRKWS